MINISAAAKTAGLPVKTVRYHADIGLVSVPERMDSGYRTYDDSAARKWMFVRRAGEFGFSIDECRELLSHPILAIVRCMDASRIARTDFGVTVRQIAESRAAGREHS